MYIHVHEFISLSVYCTYTCIDLNLCLDAVQTCLCSFTPTLHFPIRPDQPCDASESQLRAGATPSEQQPSWHQSFQRTDHPGVACHAQTATATGSHHTSVELFPPCWDNWLKHVCTLHVRVQSVYIYVHTLYMGTTYCMHIPLLCLPLHASLYHLWHRYIQCYHTGIYPCVHTGIYLLYLRNTLRMAVKTTDWTMHIHCIYVYIQCIYIYMYIHIHTLYMGTTYGMHISLLSLPLHASLYSLWHRYIQWYHTGIYHCVHTGIYLLYLRNTP